MNRLMARFYKSRLHHHSAIDWAGDRWYFADPTDPTTRDRHVRRYLCACGETVTEVREWNEFPHIVANR